MDENQLDGPQLYMVSPREIDLNTFENQLSKIVDTVDLACFRLNLSTTNEQEIIRCADMCREVLHARDVPIVITEHALLVDRLGLDGVHLVDGAKSVKKMRDELGKDAIIGSYCKDSRHEGMAAGENTADYVSFGPAGVTNLGDGRQATADLYTWWSEMIEVPVVAEGALTKDIIGTLSPHTDFFAIGDEIWGQDDPLAALVDLWSAKG